MFGDTSSLATKTGLKMHEPTQLDTLRCKQEPLLVLHLAVGLDPPLLRHQPRLVVDAMAMAKFTHLAPCA